ncbi:MAG: 5'/3'-nucleotidase SurE [Anaerolineaceae bacterium]|jgi:5'-nucleotidase|nr:5'/3'-nucleotidase SurE [Anaerolineaceae bacterium]MDD4043401.1 5'/3'-nucleotidase SurE [Anaerolineaceae bacterium]MDD4578665.1 5'/3'-nucleotidase SurE [Anaerolineaceae bacterium]
MTKRILVTNDDGVTDPGLLALVRAVRKMDGVEVSVLAPDHNWSACGHVKTMSRPLRVKATTLADGSQAFSSDGAPSDCVAMAMMGALDVKIDAVVSGINPNANVGLDVTYSGTVTAAMEGAINGVPGFAVSIDATERHQGPLEYEAAAQAAVKIIAKLLEKWDGNLPTPIWSINIPYRPKGDYAGMQFTRQGVRLYHDKLEKRVDPRGVPYYWIGGDPPSGVEEDGTDYGAIKKGFISVTPLRMDMTDIKRLEGMNPIKI